MNLDLINRAMLQHDPFPWLPPGALHEFIPDPAGATDKSLELGLVQEHRFAFCFWIDWYEKQTRRGVQIAPHLVTIDFHDDTGVEGDNDRDVLKQLNLSDPKEVALFAWCGLRPSNDGHIRPAQLLGRIQDVLVLLKDKHEDDLADEQFTDLAGLRHTMSYFLSVEDLLRRLPDDGRPVLLDIDLDYLTAGDVETVRTAASISILPRSTLSELLGLSRPLMQALSPRLAGITIALEPRYTGGISNSLTLLDWLCGEWFTGQIGATNLDWLATRTAS